MVEKQIFIVSETSNDFILKALSSTLTLLRLIFIKERRAICTYFRA